MKYNITREEFDALTPEFRKEYAEVNGKPGVFRLQLADNPVGEFRETNERLMRELREITESKSSAEAKARAAEEALANYRDDDGNPLDPAEIKRLVKTVREKGGKRDASLEDAIAAAVTPLQRAVADLTSKLTKAEQDTEAERNRAKRTATAAELRTALDRVLVPGASSYVVNDIVDLFEFDADAKALTPKGRDAEGNVLTLERAIDGLRVKSPGLFKQNGGNIEIPGEIRKNVRADGVTELINPTSLEMGKHADDIAKGKVVVKRTK